jgi:uncharacterized protein YbjT (DUF2867 family)
MTEITVLVTGATGRVGRRVVAELADRDGVRVRALSRKPGAVFGPRVDVHSGDLTNPSTLDAALDGADAVFLVFPSVSADPSAAALVETLANNARRIVYLSAHGVPEQPGRDARPDGGIIGSHAYLESLIAARAAEYAFLRSSGFAANTLAWAPQLRTADVLHWFLPEAKRALIHEADLAEVAVLALLSTASRAYHVTGPQQLTQAEQLAAIGEATGRALRFEEISLDQAPPELRPIIAAQSRMVAHPEPVTDTVAALLGRPALPYAQWARDHAADFAR